MPLPFTFSLYLSNSPIYKHVLFYIYFQMFKASFNSLPFPLYFFIVDKRFIYCDLLTFCGGLVYCICRYHLLEEQSLQHLERKQLLLFTDIPSSIYKICGLFPHKFSQYSCFWCLIKHSTFVPFLLFYCSIKLALILILSRRIYIYIYVQA